LFLGALGSERVKGRGIFAQVMTMGKSQIKSKQGLLKSTKKIEANHAFFGDN